MKENFLKYKKIGLISIVVITILSSLIIYNVSGFKELNKNNDEDIFVDVDYENIEGSSDESRSNEKKESGTVKESSEVLKEKTIIVEIKGEVNHPDVYTLDENSIINDLINLAGGVTENADLSNINRAKKLQDHEMIYIADKNDENFSQDVAKNASCTLSASNSAININSATVEELKTLNGIGDAKAKSIVEYREQSGGFKSIEEIKNVDGIGEKMFEKIKENITV